MENLCKGIGGVQKSSFIDFPGRIATVLFYNGCNLACPYCHNPTLATGSEKWRVDDQELLDFLSSRREKIDSIVITGGEPTLFETLIPLVEHLRKELGFKVKLDSNGLRPHILKELEVDYLAIDIKSSLERYTTHLGAASTLDVEKSLTETLDLLRNGQAGEVRITCAPGIVDRDAIEKIAELVKGVPTLFLQKFQEKNTILDRLFFDKMDSIGDAELIEYQQILGQVVGDCSIRQ